MNLPLSRTALKARVDTLPRITLAHLPTPLDFCPNLSAKLAGPTIYCKRDDMTGLAFGGNKTRQLEFLFPNIIEQGADIIVAGAYTQSNWCRQITAAANKMTIDVALMLLHGEKGPSPQGNLLLDHLMGADVTICDIDTMEKLPPLLEEKAAALVAQGRKPFVINPFDLDMLSCSTVGYVNAAIELDEQLEQANINEVDYLYVCGANMTPAGLAVGMRAMGRKTKVVGIAPIRWQEDRARDIARIASATAKRLDLDMTFTAQDIISHDDFIGERYGVVSDKGQEALKLMAQSESIILDPVYTSKAMAGLVEHIRSGMIKADQTVVFVHTGGIPAVFAYADELMEHGQDAYSNV